MAGVTPHWHDGDMRPADDVPRSIAIDLASTVRVITRSLRSLGLGAPGFRSPPRLIGVDRSIRRRSSGSAEHCVVSVRVRGRPWSAVVADLVEGAVVANELVSPEADRVRHALWEALDAGQSVIEIPERRVA